MSIDNEIQEIAAKIARLVHDAYKRGENDAINRLLRAARSTPNPGDSEVVIAPTPKAASSPRKRAPKGSVGALVDRALANGGGLTPFDIKEHAADECERMIAASSIRAHLRTGRKAGQYVERDRRWYSAKTETVKKEETADPAGGQAASDLWSNREDHR